MDDGHDVDLGEAARAVVLAHAAAPGAAVAASLGARTGAGVAGRSTYDATSPPIGIETPFDLASVTKPFVAVTLARLVRHRAIALSEPLGEVFPRVRGTPAAEVPIELLLAHRSGLAAHIELFAPLRVGLPFEREVAIDLAARSRRAECVGSIPPDGFAPVYSDMGYLLLGLAMEARAGLALDELVAREVLRPLGIDKLVGAARQLATPSMSDFVARVAPTEDVAFRGGVVRGVVHDENAFAMSGLGLSGHAGLFGDARAVLRFGRAILDATRADDGWLGPDDLAPLLRVRQGGSLLAGFDARTLENPSSGARLGPRTFGHLGFTGTSLWIDPDAKFVGVLLTNRVHPTREHIAIRKARPAAYDAMFDALSSTRV
ncbi:MAG: serine hydrolase domain-containing protein [Polyangiaceae bacterium]